MKRLVLLILVIMISRILNAENLRELQQLVLAGKYDQSEQYLNNWKSTYPHDPEMFIANFQYYIYRSQGSGITIQSDPNNNSTSIEISDKNGKVIGYVTDSTAYEKNQFELGLSYLDEGIKYNENRLDMYFGKIQLLCKTKQFNRAAMEILMVLNRSKVNNNIWLWSNNEAFPDPEKNMINTLQNYYEEMYNDKSQEALESLEVTSIRQIDLYPKIIFAYDNLAVAYSIRNDFDNALKYLFMALNINVNDPVVIGNIANTYRRKGDIENAKKYYQILFDMKIEPYSSKAKNMLNKL